MEGDVVDGQVDRVSREEVVLKLDEIKAENANWAFRCIITVDYCWQGSRDTSDG